MIGEPGAARVRDRTVLPPGFAIVAIVAPGTIGTFVRLSEDRGHFLGSFDEIRMSVSSLTADLGSFSRSWRSRSSPINRRWVRSRESPAEPWPRAGFVRAILEILGSFPMPGSDDDRPGASVSKFRRRDFGAAKVFDR
jgi:hypothetical protein